MTVKQIEKKQAKEAIKFDLAKKIRELLDEAKKTYGAADWDADEIESEVSELVFDDE